MLSASSHSLAQPPRQPGSAEILSAIERLSVVGNVLYVAAHPDDENTRLLSYLVSERRLRTAYLSLTRGDGGQNLIGAEQGPLLGLIRTQELLAARRVDGAEQLFTRARDFGYSKTPAETLEIWGKEQVISDVVLAIRRFKPDVIFTRFAPGTLRSFETHGHHTASAILAQEAVKRAADPAYQPEQVKQHGAWQVRRIYWNRSLWGGKPSDELLALPRLEIGGYNALIGASYGEIAADSRSMHKSQGFGAARSRGSLLEFFQPLAPLPQPTPGATGNGVFDGLDFSWARVPGSARLVQLLDQIQKGYDLRHPDASIALLLEARAELERLPDSPWKGPKLAELNQVIAACAGLYVEAMATEFSVVPGAKLAVNLYAQNRSAAQIKLREVRLGDGNLTTVNRALEKKEPWQLEVPYATREGTAISNPYWLTLPPEKGIYPIADARLTGLPEGPPALTAEFVLALGPEGRPLSITRPVLYKWTDPVAGERYRAIEVTPPVLVNPEAPVLAFGDEQPRTLRVRVRAAIDAAQGVLKLVLPAGYTAQPAELPFALAKKGDEDELRFTLRPKPGTPAAPTAGTGSMSTLRIYAQLGEQKIEQGIRRIDYPHIPIQTLFPSSAVKLSRFELKRGKNRIGYIAGAGDEVAQSLRQVGYEVTQLDDEALTSQPLVPSRFGAIVVGVRAFNTNPRLAVHHKRLMEYVAAGGNLIVQYNTNNRIAKLQAAMGPEPFEISQDRVTDETAPVALALPNHPVLTRPNRISESDFAGWVHERGLYFADKWSDKYETPLSMNDPGESPKKGSLIFVKHGKGAFIYTGLAFFRQLPAGVPGAFRLLANLIGYGG